MGKRTTQMNEPITITITPEDAAKCGDYGFGNVCLLATATKRQLGRDDVVCGGTWVKLGGETYLLSEEDSDRIINSYESLNKAAVQEPFAVTLIPEHTFISQ